jgi:hypothetical protein
MVECDLEREAGTRRTVFRERYLNLHADGRVLMHDWFRRGSLSSPTHSDPFEAFIFLWIAFNAWASCVTGHDSDRQWLEALKADRDTAATFERLRADPASLVSRHLEDFSNLWPIFRVEELRRLGIHYWAGRGQNRQERIRRFIAEGAQQFRPKCWIHHQHAGERPADWAHTLEALYRVRSNLFHGEKARSSENDQQVVRAAHGTLFAVLTETHCFPEIRWEED